MILRHLSIDGCDVDYDWTQCNTKEQLCDPLCIKWAGFDVQQRESEMRESWQIASQNKRWEFWP